MQVVDAVAVLAACAPHSAGILKTPLNSALPSKAELHFFAAIRLAHDLSEFWALRQVPGVDAGERDVQPAIASEKLVSERNHPGVGPRLRSDPHEPIDNDVLFVVRKSLRQDHRHGGR